MGIVVGVINYYYYEMANLFSSKRVGLGAKLKFYKSPVLPRLMYGAAERPSQRHRGHNLRPSTMAA